MRKMGSKETAQYLRIGGALRFKKDTGWRTMPICLVRSLYGCLVGNKLHPIVCCAALIEMAVSLDVA